MTALSWTTPAFPASALPQTALRRSWLVDMLSGRQAGENFLRLLKQLAPDKARRLRYGRPRETFAAVLSELRFPTEADYILENIEYGESSFEDVWAWGIPIDVQGYHPDRGDVTLDLAAATCGNAYNDDLIPSYGRDEHDEVRKWVATWWTKAEAPSRPVRPPRGRDFIQPWNGLPDLARYVTQSVGNDWLDLNYEDIDGGNYPPWSVAEIRALERLWKNAKPADDRIWALVRHINAAPRTHLPAMVQALRGDKETLLKISRAKAQPLWKAFKGKARQ